MQSWHHHSNCSSLHPPLSCDTHSSGLGNPHFIYQNKTWLPLDGSHSGKISLSFSITGRHAFQMQKDCLLLCMEHVAGTLAPSIALSHIRLSNLTGQRSMHIPGASGDLPITYLVVSQYKPLICPGNHQHGCNH